MPNFRVANLLRDRELLEKLGFGKLPICKAEG